MNIVFMGTPDFAAPILKKLTDAGYDVLLAVTQPDRARDRGRRVSFCPVKELALAQGIRVLQPEHIKGNTNFIRELKAAAPDLIVVAAYGRILPAEILELPAYGCLNVHASLLPRFRGASPIQQAILEGDEVTGVTLMQMAEGLDTGDILAQAGVRIRDMDYRTLSSRLSQEGAELLVRTIPMIAEGRVRALAQDESRATYCSVIDKEQGRVDFASMTPLRVTRMIRAYYPWPGVYFGYGQDTIRIRSAADTGQSAGGAAPGTVLAASDEGIDVSCGGGVLRISGLQPAGKKEMKAADYLRGHRLEKGTVLAP